MTDSITDEQREVCAVSVMRAMLTDYCDEKGIPFEQAFFEFSNSLAYKMLFDYSTGLWKEGSDYLRGTFEDTKKQTQKTHARAESDPFLTEPNLSHIKKSVQELRDGKGTAHDLIDDNE